MGKGMGGANFPVCRAAAEPIPQPTPPNLATCPQPLIAVISQLPPHQHLTAERSRTLARSTPSGCGPRQAAGGATRPTGSATRRSAAQCGASASTSLPGSRWRMSVGRSRPCRTRCRRSSGASTPSPTTRGSRPWAGPTRRRSERTTREGVFDASAHAYY